MTKENKAYQTEHFDRVNVSFIQTNKAQEMKGIAKYGKPLDPLDNYNWNRMALEEAVDLVKYLEAEQVKKEITIKKIRVIIEANMADKGPREEIHYWLDLLEGTKN